MPRKGKPLPLPLVDPASHPPPGFRAMLIRPHTAGCLRAIDCTGIRIQSIVAQLRQEASRIENAIAALVGLGSQPARRGRPPKGSQAKPASGRKRRRMSASARARIGAAKKAWWAKQKGKGYKKVMPVSKKSTARKPMSAATVSYTHLDVYKRQ